MNYATFNLVEGIFWIVLGLAILLVMRKFPIEFRRLSIFSIAVLILFGISDFVESQLGSFFEPGLLWLFAWKALCAIGLIVSVSWYLRIRLRA